MSGKLGHRDFKILFGADDSDEDIQENNNTAQSGINIVHSDHYIDSKQKSESFSRDSNKINKSGTIDKWKTDDNNDSKKRNFDLDEVNKSKKKIKPNDEHQPFFSISKETVSNGAKTEIKGNKELSEVAPYESNNKKNIDDKRTILKKMEVGTLVVKLLTPAYVERRFESKETFKALARNISHALANKDEQEIKEYIRNFLSRNEEFTSETTL